MNQRKIFTRTRLSMAVMVALAAPAMLQVAHAGAGFGDNTDILGNAIKVPTFYANSPSGLLPVGDCFDATSALATAIPATATTPGVCDSGTALRKFVNTLPGLGAAAANNLGQYIPIAVPDTTSYPGSDYYEIAVVDYAEQMHSDLKKMTHLRGYVQLSTTNVPGSATPLTNADGTAVRMPSGLQAKGVDKAHYLGPLISATKGRAVRIKYYNLLPTGTPGKLFLPVDATFTEAGILPGATSKLTENRAAIHWHGGDTPWVSDGTPHQWIAPAGEVIPGTTTPMGKGVSAVSVPDMPAPGDGAQTLYFPNNMSGRFMFYHDHTAGLTRLNVYAGIAAGYLLSDPTETAMVAGGPLYVVDSAGNFVLDTSGNKIPKTDATGTAISFAAGTLPADQIPLVIQDKTFVPKDIGQQDSAWNRDVNTNATLNVWGSEGDLWFPHVYETNQDPSSFDATNPVGRWDWGPWFWPVFPSAYSLPSGLVGDASSTPEAFMDTPIVNGTAYPTTTVEPKAYRFRILNASNDRFLNLGLYQATTGVSQITISTNGSGYSTNPAYPPQVIITPTSGVGHGATAVATVDPTGSITRIDMTNVGADYTAPVKLTIVDPTYPAGPLAPVAHLTAGSGFAATGSITTDVNSNPFPTEVEMVAFDTTQAVATPFPVSGGLQGTGWGSPDSTMHASGVPNPLKLGPDIIQIGTEGGFLPHAVTIPSTPINYEYNKRSVTVLNVLEHGVFMGPAERVDAVIDFSQYAGKTLILYNDAPAPLPAGDPRIDYYSGAPDQTGAGGAAPTLAGYGPNTRTIMQIKVNGTSNGTAFNKAGLEAALPKAYAVEQAPPVIPEIAYNDAFGTNDTNNLLKISTGSLAQSALDFTPTGAMTLQEVKLVGGGTGYRAAPTVTFVGGLGTVTTTCGVPTAATATATINAVTRMVTGFTNFTPGCGYTSMPTVQLTATNGGTGATANAKSNTTTSLPVQNKGIQELFDPFYGRMNATFAVELPFTTAANQTTIPLAYIDPATEKIADGETQIWKITHNGVDSHPVHFHLVNVQVINRVGWDGTIKPPYDNEFGWKETLRMNPLEDVYVAATAKQPKTNAFGLPQSVRLRDPSQAQGANIGFTQIDPVTGNPKTIANQLENFNNEYVWHCHILGHEEFDFMRPVVFEPRSPDATSVTGWKSALVSVTDPDSGVTTSVSKPALDAPLAPTLSQSGGVLSWIDNSDKEIQFNIERAPFINGVTGGWANIGTALANAGMQSWDSPVTGVGKGAGIITDTTPKVNGQSYQYRVAAVGAAATSASVIDTTVSSYSNVVTIDVAPLAPTTLTFGATTTSSVVLNWTDVATNETSYMVEWLNGATWTAVATCTAANLTSCNVTGLPTANTTYQFRVSATNTAGQSGFLTGSYATDASAATALTFVTPAVQTQIGLSWTNSNLAGTTTETVTRTPGTIAVTPVTNHAVTATGLTAGTSYTFTVNVTGVNSKVVSATAVTSTAAAAVLAPAAPTGVSIQRTSATAATLAWTDASNNETSFQVQTSPATGTPTWTNLGAAIARNAAQGTATGGGLTYVAAVTASTNLLYRVEALNASPAAGISASVSLNDTVAPVAAVLAAPAKAAWKIAGFTIGTTVTLNWTDPANNNATYTLQRSTNGGTSWTNVSTTLAGNATTTTQNILGLTVTTNLYRLTAVNSVGTAISNTVTIVTP